MNGEVVTRVSMLPDGVGVYRTADGLLFRVPSILAGQATMPASRVTQYITEAVAMLDRACAMARMVC